MPQHSFPAQPPLRPRRGLPGALAAALVLQACALQVHVPPTASPARAQAAVQALTPDDPALRPLLAQQGVDTRVWPMPVWDAKALRALALARHPEMQLARAELAQAKAAHDADRRTPVPASVRALEPTLDHHSAAGASSSPWSLGVVLEFGEFPLAGPVLGVSRRAAREDAAEALADEATLKAAQTAWRVHRSVRDAHQALWLAGQRAELAEAQSRIRSEAAAAWQTRFSVGAADSRALAQARQAESDAAREAREARATQLRARQALDLAVGLTVAQAQHLVIGFAELPAPPIGDAAIGNSLAALQQAALLDRLDVRLAVARYAAADAALRAALSRQLPALVLKPGWAWDQGDRRWSLGVGIQLPAIGGNQAAIAQASARRDAEAAGFDVLQLHALAELDAARAATVAAGGELLQAQSRAEVSAIQSEQARTRVAAGSADRLELIEARRAALDAQRHLLDARGAQWAALAALEDAVQRPFDAVATVAVAQRRASATTRATAVALPVEPRMHGVAQ